MTPEQKINRLTNWQVGLFIVPIVLHLIRTLGPATTDPDKQLALTLIRFGITVLALVLVGVLEWRKRKIRKEGRAPSNPEQPKFDL